MWLGVSVDLERGIVVRSGGREKRGSRSRDDSNGVARLEGLSGGVFRRNKSCDEF